MAVSVQVQEGEIQERRAQDERKPQNGDHGDDEAGTRVGRILKKRKRKRKKRKEEGSKQNTQLEENTN